MNRRWKCLGVVVTLVVLTPFVSAAGAADTEDPRLRSGAFLGAHFIYAISDFDFGRSAVSAGDSPGFEVFAGYRFNRYVSLEGVFQYLSEFRIKGPSFGGARGTIARAWALSLMPATKVYPLADVLPPWMQPYGMFGIGVLFAHSDPGSGFFSSDNDATAAFRFGGGIDFYLVPQLVLRAGGGYVLGATDLNLFGGDIDPSYAPISVGLEYRF